MNLPLKRLAVAVVAVVATILFAAYVLPIFFPFSHLDWSETRFDLCSGRLRHVSYFLGFCVKDTVEETEISRLYCKRIGDPPQPTWVFLHGGGGWVLADGDHTSWSAACVATAALESQSLTEEAETEVLRTVFRLLQNERDRPRALSYAEAVYDMSTSRRAHVCKIGPNDLPAPPEADAVTGSQGGTP